MDDDRLEKEREAYREKDISQTQKIHSPSAIARSLKKQEPKSPLSDVILGGQDGLVNVLGVVLGVAAATSEPSIIQVAGLAAAFAQSVSMGAVAYTSTQAEADYYKSELAREKWEIENNPSGEKEEIRQIYRRFGFSGQILDEVVEKITRNRRAWIEVMMAEELKLAPIASNQAFKSAVIVSISSLIGAFIPLTPFFVANVRAGIVLSLIVSVGALFVVGVYKAKLTVGKWYRSGLEMILIGISSALVGYAIGLIFKTG